MKSKSFQTLALSAAFENPPKFGYDLTTFDFALTVHILPKSSFDPYWLIGLGAGACGVDCSGGKAFTKLGGRLGFGLYL